MNASPYEVGYFRTPQISAGLPKVGGRLKADPSDFVVEEIPAYAPEGEGDHAWLWVEKRNVAGQDLLRRIATALGCSRGEVGTAGTKDKRAITRQWVSVHDPEKRIPVSQEPLDVDVIDAGEGIRVLRSVRHPKKLRTGHLWGNHFEVVISDVEVDDAPARVRAVLDAVEDNGMPNFYGPQRFGSDNVPRGLRWVRGEGRPRGSRFVKRMVVSSVQSWLFNLILADRVREGLVSTVIVGDVLSFLERPGMFVCSKVGEDQPRFDARELVHTGPIVGSRTFRAEADAAEREQRVLRAVGLDYEDFAKFGKLALGSRRDNLVYPRDVEVSESPTAGSVRLTFSLPRGTYATVLLDEIMVDASHG